MGAVVQDVDKGYAELVKRVFGMAKTKTRIDVGVLEGKADEPHGGEDVDQAVTVLQVAIWNEFGTERIEARSFIRGWFDENEANLRRELVTLLQLVVAGQRTKEQVLEMLGMRAVGQIQARIAAGISPPNKPSTVAAKGSSTPLIDTGTLRSSITYRVVEGG